MITKKDLRDSYSQLMRDELKPDHSGRLILAAWRKWKNEFAFSNDERPTREAIIDLAVDIRDSERECHGALDISHAAAPGSIK